LIPTPGTRLGVYDIIAPIGMAVTVGFRGSIWKFTPDGK
jgi:hypothetical protein